MREIKFRIWYKPQRVMSEPETIQDMTGYTPPLDLDDNHILMQFTGLHDKNGKEIYEGDLIRLQGNAFVNHEIYWDEQAFQFRLCATHNDKREFDKTHLLTFAKSGVIIGNIYENPELLEGK